MTESQVLTHCYQSSNIL